MGSKFEPPQSQILLNFLANDWVQLRELLNKVCDLVNLLASRVFGWCVGIAVAGVISAAKPCSWVELVLKCRLTRQLVCGWGMGEKYLRKWITWSRSV